MIKVIPHEENQGFFLTKPFEWNEDLLVVTGLNGSGKTRLLRSLKEGKIKCEIEEEEIDKIAIEFIQSFRLVPPDHNDRFHYGDFDSKVQQTLSRYDQIKSVIDDPYDPKNQIYRNHINNQNRGNRNPLKDPLNVQDLHTMCHKIAMDLGKKPSELTHDEIRLHWEEPIQSLFLNQRFSELSNQYIKRLHQNKFNEWGKKEKNWDVSYYEPDEFADRFGKRPWVVLNDILTDTFDGKFLFAIPDENSNSYSYQAQLIDQENESVVNNNRYSYLSSGESTLYWLAISLFNTIYFKDKIVTIPKLLLLDEPDAALHPKMIEQMFKSLNGFAKRFGTKIILSTHSPTTVAICERSEIAVISNNEIHRCDKDTAISSLLKGVPQISITPENRRQVYVESIYDARIYQALYIKLLKVSKSLDSRITLTFISSGPKMPRDQITQKLEQILMVSDEELINEFVAQINGVGNCVQVYGMVKSLDEKGDRTSRGIVDWDKKNKPTDKVCVLAEKMAYALENVVLDPICIMVLLQTQEPMTYTIQSICGEDVELEDLLKDTKLLQNVTDCYLRKVLERESKHDYPVVYSSGVTIQSDNEYFLGQGHGTEKNIVEKFPELRRFSKQGKDGALKEAIVTRSINNLTSGKFIPKVIEDLFLQLQQEWLPSRDALA
jgi:ABC-type cobalamin/Fe3+-siderophores transport system ATPase subunit